MHTTVSYGTVLDMDFRLLGFFSYQMHAPGARQYPAYSAGLPNGMQCNGNAVEVLVRCVAHGLC